MEDGGLAYPADAGRGATVRFRTSLPKASHSRVRRHAAPSFEVAGWTQIAPNDAPAAPSLKLRRSSARSRLAAFAAHAGDALLAIPVTAACVLATSRVATRLDNGGLRRWLAHRVFVVAARRPRAVAVGLPW